VPTWRVRLRDGDVLDVNADWLADRPAMLTFESVHVVIVESPRWVVVRRVARTNVQRLEQLS